MSGFQPDHIRYNFAMLTDLEIGDVLRLKKPHPCGGYIWRITRLGADIRLECMNCGRRVILSRREVRNRLKKNLGKEADEQTTR
jgi:hypothetical protein